MQQGKVKHIHRHAQYWGCTHTPPTPPSGPAPLLPGAAPSSTCTPPCMYSHGDLTAPSCRVSVCVHVGFFQNVSVFSPPHPPLHLVLRCVRHRAHGVYMHTHPPAGLSLPLCRRQPGLLQQAGGGRGGGRALVTFSHPPLVLSVFWKGVGCS